jgi:hypothetical protein
MREIRKSGDLFQALRRPVFGRKTGSFFLFPGEEPGLMRGPRDKEF